MRCHTAVKTSQFPFSGPKHFEKDNEVYAQEGGMTGE
jgi:hypothetical protein